jgi:hypothetical protein
MTPADIKDKLAQIEGVPSDDLHPSLVPSTVRQDNRTRRSGGRQVRFNVYGDGTEERGYISLLAPAGPLAENNTPATQDSQAIGKQIEQENLGVRRQLQAAIAEMSWQEFESNFLEQILEGLGFSDISITQRSRDGGSDAYCTYKRGLVVSTGIVSAKHWKTQNVGIDEVRRVRGIKHEADTAIIVTSASFSQPAIDEAAPAMNIRSVSLIDGDLIVDTCMKQGIGVESVKLPVLYRFNGFVSDEREEP